MGRGWYDVAANNLFAIIFLANSPSYILLILKRIFPFLAKMAEGFLWPLKVIHKLGYPSEFPQDFFFFQFVEFKCQLSEYITKYMIFAVAEQQRIG